MKRGVKDKLGEVKSGDEWEQGNRGIERQERLEKCNNRGKRRSEMEK